MFEDGWPPSRAALTVTLADGTTFEARHDSGIPAADVAAQGKRIEAKFLSLAQPILGAARARGLADAVGALDGAVSPAEMMALAAG